VNAATTVRIASTAMAITRTILVDFLVAIMADALPDVINVVYVVGVVGAGVIYRYATLI
jgi:hypothetical protein